MTMQSNISKDVSSFVKGDVYQFLTKSSELPF